MSGRAELDAFIARVESLAMLNERVADAATEPVADVVREHCERGVDPEGKAWPDRQEGGKALRGAAEAVQARAKGNAILLSIGAPYAYHNWGAGGSSTTKKAEAARRRARAHAAKSGTVSRFHAPRRQILPVAGEPIPSDMAEAVGDAAKKVFDRSMGGR